MRIKQNKTGHLNFRALRDGFAEATEVGNFSIYIGKDSRGYYVKVRQNSTNWHQEEHFPTVAGARKHFGIMSRLAGAERVGMRGV